MKRRNFIWSSLLFLASCTAITNNPRKNSNNFGQIELEKIRLAITDVKGLEQLERDYDPFRLVLEEALATKIEFFPVENYIEAASALQLGLVELVFAGPSEYVVINARTNAVPVIALTRPRYRSIIAVRGDSGITSLAQLKGKTMAITNIGSTASHLGTTKLLIDAGLDPQTDIKFLILEDSTNGKKGLDALQKGEADAWGVAIYRYEKYRQERGLSEEELPAIATGELLPSDVFVASSKLASKTVEHIRDRFLKHKEQIMQGIWVADDKFRGGDLVPANDSDYDLIRQVYRAIGQDDFLG